MKDTRNFINPKQWIRSIVKSTIRPRPRMKFWEWADKNVVVPDEVQGPMPGPLNTGRLPIFRGLYDLAQQRHVHFLCLCASARVGKTLFSTVIMLYWIAERIGSVVWLDPSGTSAKKVSKSDIEPFIQNCKVVRELGIYSGKTWQIQWKQFRGKILRIIGSGSEADLHGFNAELAILNELDRQKEASVNLKGARNSHREDAGSADKVIERTVLFPYTRLILENSTPGIAGEFSPIWISFLRGSQHYCYVPCAACTQAARKAGKTFSVPSKAPTGWSDESLDPTLCGWQRLTFSPEKKLVPFGEDLLPLLDEKGQPVNRDKWREESTGGFKFDQFATWEDSPSPGDATKIIRRKTGFDLEAVEHGTTYKCAHCGEQILNVQLRWMITRYRWVSHNPDAPSERVSAHVWRAYAPTELGGSWGRIAKEFLVAGHDVAALIKWHNMTCGLPFVRTGSAVKESDIERCVSRTPTRYLKGQLPRKPEFLLMTVDVQKDHFWYAIRAYGVVEELEGYPTWSALVDWGQATSFDEIMQLAGEKKNSDGIYREFTFIDPETKDTSRFRVLAGLIDSGNDADTVYDYCLLRSRIFDAYKGAAGSQTKWSPIKLSDVYDNRLSLWLCWSDYFASSLYYDCIKHGQEHGSPVYWWLPVDVDSDYRKQLCDEYQEAGTWMTRSANNHLGDCEKMQRAIGRSAEAKLDEVRELLDKKNHTEDE